MATADNAQTAKGTATSPGSFESGIYYILSAEELKVKQKKNQFRVSRFQDKTDTGNKENIVKLEEYKPSTGDFGKELVDNIFDKFENHAMQIANIERIKSFARYEYNWNGYGADRFAPELISYAQFIVSRLPVQPRIFPTAQDSIQLEYYYEDYYLEIEIFEDHLELYERRANGSFKQIDEVELEQVIARINEFKSSRPN